MGYANCRTMETVEKPHLTHITQTLPKVFPPFPPRLENSSFATFSLEFPTVHTAPATTT